MVSVKLLRRSGLSGMLAGALTVILNVMAIAGPTSTTLGNAIIISTIPLTIFALLGMHARQRDDAGRLGRAGLIAAVTSLALTAGLMLGYAALARTPVPPIAGGFAEDVGGPFAVLFSLSGVLYLLGYLLFGIATVRADVLPPPAGWLLVAGVAVDFFGGSSPVMGQAGAILIGLGLGLLAYALYLRPAEPRALISKPRATV